MADLPQRTNYTAAYSGLLDNLYLTLAIAGACLGGYELLVHMPRRRGKQGRFQRVPVRAFFALKRFWTNRKRGRIRNNSSSYPSDHKRQTTEDTAQTKTSKEEFERARLGSQEDWEFGYIYQPKAWAVNASPPLPRWPLAWIATALKVKERDMPDKCGLDHTLHARFLRGCLFYTILQAFVVLPILLPLHVLYSPHDLSNSSMVKASISSLVETSGARWLWVHAVLIWWVTLTWIATTLWIAWGGLGYRRRQIKQLRRRIETGQYARRQLTGGEDGNAAAVHGDDCEGIKRFKTIMVTNVPPDMRNEQTIRDYFEHHIHRYRARFGDGAQQPKSSPIFGRKKSEKGRLARHSSVFRKNNEKGETPHSSPVPEEELSANDCASADDEHEAREVDEVIFVRKLGPLENLRARRHAVLRQLEAAHVKLAQRILRAVASHKASPEYTPSTISTDFTHLTIPPGISKKERLDLLTDALGAFVDGGPVERGESKQTVWEVLHSLPRELLDPYQALTHLSSLFRKENAPLIDYLTTKLNYLTLLVDEARSKSLDAYPPSSTAFVTFKDASTARVALSILPGHPKRSLACHTCSAPDWTDLLWSRLAKSTYRASFVRGWIVFLGVWLFTLIWIFPVSVFCTLTSLSNIAQFIKPLAKWLADNPKASSAITSLAPVILVALLTLAICPILLVISNKAETIVTRYGIHQSVMERFWKFLIVNGVVFFAIGQSAIEAYLAAFQESNFDPLPIVASAFPSAAPYFASYILLQVAIQPFFEIFRFGLPTILYVFGTRVSIIPRQRASRTNYPTFSHFSQVPQQLLAGAIMHLFMLLNPLVIPFIVWKRQFTYVYGRLYESNGRRTAIRAMRYSIDGLAHKAKGNAIATGILFFLTLIAKLM
ncbi:hypothetical protein TREMEDRAFT_66911 [Tremella mesenterica DSM 1558]|uniref:uncharacterized protein n=1 Tax=Tremella mesenterica (strain ATCC 24925 / CBS 8224 / DSM 1558 / NBRC 9311 / NRRL Y-6157 / RJB 2259-6 / UBC 559-6) TaxID=578456 RepID=UPI0003F4915E|nr:uncharacterized protein TREMEDRAFT_66911 [Tremella mesenterica DSM 1558]EIW72492.1 hypothetical protein TREMEDRAFT_66911 [Tremella mesenterica DSM 1558]